ncbi:MAG: prepilin-type N-terminal cleavage/methylation domain-containing protein [Candidatus Sumerlaeia bacterium]|nr:prepilin-type N-terminal cleavage/methylation domain-containing protein [Candidatus Sumerlaeia bacterium]
MGIQTQAKTHKNRRTRSGFSLLEILIALPILALVSMALVSGTVFASRLSRIVCNQVAAKNIAQSYFERMAIDDFDDVTPANYPSVTLATSPPLYLDSVRRTRCTVDIVITGYGRAESGSASSITDTDASWTPNEWTGNTVLLIGGRGRGQRAQITGNSNNTLNLNAKLNPTPDATTWYAINGGKTVRITTRWSYLGKEYRARIESLVINWGPRR